MDGVAWLTGHVRIDAREQLLKDLGIHNLIQGTPTDAQLILQAYRVFGRDFVNRIIGDYSFVIWNEHERQLLAVRDHLGTRPLFYAQTGQTWILSNTLDCVRLHPGVSGELDDIWLFDYLAQFSGTDFERTAYSKIRRLPPAHVLEVIPPGGKVRKYWQLDIGEPIFYKRREEYLEHFRDLARTTIRDRIRIGRIGVGMSGGLDSTSIVAFLLQLVAHKADDIVVNNTYFEKLVFDDERHYAAAAADYFGISINFQNVDSTIYDPQWWTRSWVPPEPNVTVLSRFVAMDPAVPYPFNGVRVMFVGQGPDEALSYVDWKQYLRWLLKTRRFMRFGSAVYSRLSAKPLGERLSGLCATFRSYKAHTALEKPVWLRSDAFDHGTPLADVRSHKLFISDKRHSWHPRAVQHFLSAMWQDYFESYDPGFGGRLIEAVHPYLDIRMLQFLLSVPIIPWCHRKLLMRESMRGLLPEMVLARDKTALADDPWVKAMVQHPFPPISKNSELSRYVDTSKIPSRWGQTVQENRYLQKLFALQYWLAARDGRSVIQNR
jgi:asparagine synthase (glutamine-hydrolysing)